MPKHISYKEHFLTTIFCDLYLSITTDGHEISSQYLDKSNLLATEFYIYKQDFCFCICKVKNSDL